MPAVQRALGWLAPVILACGAGVLGCQERTPAPAPTGSIPAPASAAAPSSASAPAASASPPTPAAPAAKGPVTCPDGMGSIPGGRFKVGSDGSMGAPEETPPFETEVAPFCMDITEVTVDAYAKCVSAGACQKANDDRRFCNARFPDRGDHPINCVDWSQANAFCGWRSARLPREVEWEYAARGGTEYRAFSWGNEPPDGHTCWKHVGGSCKVRSYPAGAFGLYDVIGNVWEWTDDWFGEYPWPPETGLTKVYRGGSWSRRFVKWMSPRLRNRYTPKEWGSHLGFRCALTLPDTTCPYGRTSDGKRCEYGVASVACPGRARWNGVRCALPGEPECPTGKEKHAGHGCVIPGAVSGPAPEVETTPITRLRTPEFDADCAQNKPGRPHAYRYSGGTHHGRNLKSGGEGCANRDVGVGWNSTCCP